MFPGAEIMPLHEWPVDVALLFVCCGAPIIILGVLGASAPVAIAGAILALLGTMSLVLEALRSRLRRGRRTNREG
jgi:hypothetical protein